MPVEGIAGPLSAVRLDAWLIACTSSELGKTPLARTLQGVPFALFRGNDGAPAAFVDRCPHRNVPLSLGHCEHGTLRCVYHGWRFDDAGACVEIPGLVGEIGAKARNATSHPARERDGFVWVWTGDGAPKGEPFRFPLLDQPGYVHVRREFTVASTMHAAIENALDVPHTAFLHGGLFRKAEKKNDLEVIVRRYADRIEAEYVGEPRPPGIAGRVLAPGGGVVTHFDRFLLPCIAQVEYRLGTRSHLVTTSAMVPVSDLETRVYAVVSFRLPIPAFVVKLFLTPIGERIFRQDAEILAQQTGNIRRFGGEKFVHTDIDVLGNEIYRLLKAAERNELSSDPGILAEHRLKMRT